MGKENSYNKSIGKNIKLARIKAKYTQEKLAEEIGISSRYVSQLERGLAFGSANTIVNICNTLHIDSNFLFNDLINTKNSTSVNNLVDQKFLHSYIQLTPANKQFTELIVNQLLKLQNDKKSKRA